MLFEDWISKFKNKNDPSKLRSLYSHTINLVSLDGIEEYYNLRQLCVNDNELTTLKNVSVLSKLVCIDLFQSFQCMLKCFSKIQLSRETGTIGQPYCQRF